MNKGSKVKKELPLNNEDIYLQKLGARIKALRIQKGYKSYEQFAFEHGISRTQFGRYEQGKDIQFSTLVRIVEALDMSFAEFFSIGFDNL